MENSKQTLTRSPSPPLLLLFFVVTAAPLLASADKFIVGDRNGWAPGVNYTAWAEKYQFHVGDWLVFYYEKGLYDVMEVNATAYAACAADAPIVNWTRGRSFAYQFNRTGDHYFICGRGYCYNGMKLAILAQPLPPPPSPAPAYNAAAATATVVSTLSGRGRRLVSWIAAAASVFALV